MHRSRSSARTRRDGLGRWSPADSGRLESRRRCAGCETGLQRRHCLSSRSFIGRSSRHGSLDPHHWPRHHRAAESAQPLACAWADFAIGPSLGLRVTRRTQPLRRCVSSRGRRVPAADAPHTNGPDHHSSPRHGNLFLVVSRRREARLQQIFAIPSPARLTASKPGGYRSTSAPPLEV